MLSELKMLEFLPYGLLSAVAEVIGAYKKNRPQYRNMSALEVIRDGKFRRRKFRRTDISQY